MSGFRVLGFRFLGLAIECLGKPLHPAVVGSMRDGSPTRA